MCPQKVITRVKVPLKYNFANKSALFPQAAPCPFSILGRTLYNNNNIYIYIYIYTYICFVGRRFQKKVLPNTSCQCIRHFGGHFTKWRHIFQTMRQETSLSCLHILFMGNIIQIVHCYAHHTIVGTFWLAVVAICSK